MDALTVRAPNAAPRLIWEIHLDRGEKGRTTFGRGGITLKVLHQLPDETTPYKSRARKRDQQTRIERVVE